MPTTLGRLQLEPEAIGVLGWQTGTEALCLYSQSQPQGTDLADNSLDRMECTAHHPGSMAMAGIVSVTMLLLSIKDLALSTFH